MYLCPMEEYDYKKQIILYPSDYEVVSSENGIPVNRVDIWSYCSFFAEKIQLVYCQGGYDGTSLSEYSYFMERKTKDFHQRVINFIKDEQLYNFQKEMQDKHGVHVNILALCNLCLFIDKIVHRKLIVLLRPTIADTIGEIHDLESITFTNKDGKATTTSNKALIKQVKDVLKQEGEVKYEVERIVTRKEVFTKELMQIEFFYYLSSFFQQFFPIKRRGLLTNAEVKICLYFMKWLGLSAEILTNSRLRQLRMNFSQVGVGNIFEARIDDKDIRIQLTFVKYKDWKDGKINPLKKCIDPMGEGEIIDIPPDFDKLVVKKVLEIISP